MTTDPAADNGDRDSQQAAVTIMAGEFTSGDNPVRWAWSAGQCKVFHGIREVEYSIEDEIKLFGLSPIKFPKDEVLQVRWLTPQPAPAREQETAGEDEEAVTDDERESIEQIVSQYEMGNRHTAFKLYKELYPDGYKDEESIQHSIEYMRRVIIAQNTEKQIADLKAENSALQRQLATAEGEIGRLRTALKPFAIQWDEFVKYVAEMGYILSDQEISFDDFHQDYLDGEVDADHYRQAASALEASQPKAADADDGGGNA